MPSLPPKRNLATILIGLTSFTMVHLFRSESNWLLGSYVVVQPLAGLLLAALTAGVFRQRDRVVDRGGVLLLLLSAGCVSPLLLGRIDQWSGQQDSMDVATLMSLANITLQFAMLGRFRNFQNLTALFSGLIVFLVMPMTRHPLSYFLASAFGILVLWWSMGNYWANLDQKMADRVSSSLAVRSRTLAYFVVLLCLLCFVSVPFFATGNIDGPSLSWFSGGDRWSDDHARDGLGDGSQVRAAVENPATFGPVDSDVFLESQRPSLFDVANEIYGKPRKNPSLHKAVALGQEPMRHNHSRMTRSDVGGKQFSTARESRSSEVKPREDLRSAAMFRVKSNSPNRFAIAHFEIFEAGEWKTIEPTVPNRNRTLPGSLPRPDRQWEDPDVLPAFRPVRAAPLLGEYWMEVRRHPLDSLYQSWEYAAIEVLNLHTTAIPSLPCLEGVKIDAVDREDFFGIGVDEMVHLTNNSDRIPDLTVIHTLGRGISLYEALSRPQMLADRLAARRSDMLRFLEFHPEGRQAELLDLHLKRWLVNCETAWDRAAAIVDHLRHDFTHAADGQMEEGEDDCVVHLLEKKSGPDYMFATTAALMLRRAGIPSRVVSGFLPDVEKFDRQTGSYPVFADDLHLWVEISLDGVGWIPLEPTPGFPLPRYRLTLWQSLQLVKQEVLEWISRNPALGALVVGLLTGLLLYRRYLSHCWLTAQWWFAAWGAEHQVLLATADLVNHRARLNGYPRPISATPARFLQGLSDRFEMSPQARSSLDGFCRSLNQILYCPDLHGRQLSRSDEIKTLCRVVEREFNWKKMRRLKGRGR